MVARAPASSSRAGTRVSRTKRPPNGPKRPEPSAAVSGGTAGRGAAAWGGALTMDRMVRKEPDGKRPRVSEDVHEQPAPELRLEPRALRRHQEPGVADGEELADLRRVELHGHREAVLVDP